MGKTLLLTLDRLGFLRRLHEDPLLAFRILERLPARICSLDEELSRLKRFQP